MSRHLDTLGDMAGGGRKWLEVPEEFAARLREHLFGEGGSEALGPLSPAEVWRVKLSDATFTYYANGTLYSTGSPLGSAAVAEAWAFIDAGLPPRFVSNERAFSIGLDESGKGELVGHLMLACALVPKTLAVDVQGLVELAETKRKRSDGYFDRLFTQLDALRPKGLDFVIERVPPQEVDRYNLNQLLDVNYRRILSAFLHCANLERCRIVLDNYRVGPSLDGFLRALEGRGAEVIVEARADDRYLEVRVASVLARREREKELQAINNDAKFHVDGLSVGSGSSSSARTLAWLGAWKKTGKAWPWFIRRSYRSVCNVDGSSPPRKQEPPIQDEPVD